MSSQRPVLDQRWDIVHRNLGGLGLAHFDQSVKALDSLKLEVSDLVEQFEAQKRVIEALEALGHHDLLALAEQMADSFPASQPDVSERVDVRPHGPPTGGNPSVGEARSEAADPAKGPS